MDLVTGGTGIVGAHVLLALAGKGSRVRALARPAADRDLVARIFRHYHGDAGSGLYDQVEWVDGDLLDPHALLEACTGVRHVYHAAAVVSFAPGDAVRMRLTNVGGTAAVVDAAREAGVERLCHVSSTAALGRPTDGPAHEETPWNVDLAISPYARSKYDAELEVYRGIAEGLDAVIVNPCVVLGPGAQGRSSMALAERLGRGTRFHPPGSNAVVDARDLAEAMLKATASGTTGRRYVIAGENLSYRALFHMYADAYGHAKPEQELQPWMLEAAWRIEAVRSLFTGRKPLVTRHTVASSLSRRSYDASRARTELGMVFRTAEESVLNVVRWRKEQR
jgi:dihydroflavonol-4-reductase